MSANPANTDVPPIEPQNNPPAAEEVIQYDIPITAADRFDLGSLSTLVTFSIRDGIPDNICSMIVRPTIPLAYRWRPVKGVNADNARDHIDLFIKTAIAGLLTNMPTDWDGPKCRIAGILMGTARAATVWTYNIGESDIVPGELADAYFSVSAGGVITAGSNLTAAIKANVSYSTPLTDAEKDLMYSVVRFGAGILPLQGYSLMTTQHHYLSEAAGPSRRAFSTLESQFWKDPSIKATYESETDVWRDVLWHKACHPVQINLKKTLAAKEETKASLIKMDIGAAAARLPVIESELRAASSWITVMNTVKTYFEAYGSTLDFFILKWALDTAKAMPVDDKELMPNELPPAEVVDTLIVPNRTHTRPAYVKNRTTAVKWVAEIMERNSNVVALAYGFYMALSDNAQLSSTETFVDTLKGAYSLKKLRNQSMASFYQGMEAYKDYVSYKARQRSEGAYGLVSAGMS